MLNEIIIKLESMKEESQKSCDSFCDSDMMAMAQFYDGRVSAIADIISALENMMEEEA